MFHYAQGSSLNELRKQQKLSREKVEDKEDKKKKKVKKVKKGEGKLNKLVEMQQSNIKGGLSLPFTQSNVDRIRESNRTAILLMNEFNP